MFRLEGVIIRLFVEPHSRYTCTVLDVSAMWFNEKPDDDSFGSKHVAICII